MLNSVTYCHSEAIKSRLNPLPPFESAYLNAYFLYPKTPVTVTASTSHSKLSSYRLALTILEDKISLDPN